MNYVERHFGDWARDTAHLSLIEDGAYMRLTDLYYVREQPLPADLAACCRLVRASSKPERAAVKVVLAEFFNLTEEGYRHKRCDAEIARFHEKRDKAKRSAEARWNNQPSQSERNANASPPDMRTNSEIDANAYANAVPTQCEGNAPSNQAPSTKHQKNKTPASATDDRKNGTAAGHLSLALRESGVMTSPHEPRLIALAEAGITASQARSAAEEAKRAKPGERIPPAYVYSILERWLAEPASAPARSKTSEEIAAEAFRIIDERAANAAR